MMTEYESNVMTDILVWSEDFYMSEGNFFTHSEMIEDYWRDYIYGCEMGKSETGLETL